MSITLSRDRSGTWGVPERVKRLKAWQRLWVATGVVYLLLIVGAGYLLMPTRERLDRDMVFAVTEEVKRYEGLVFAGESPERIFEAARRQGYDAWIAGLRTRYRIGPEGDAGFTRIDREYRREMGRLTRRRVALSAVLCLAWLAPMGALYAMGAVVDWINRGGRRDDPGTTG